MCAVSSEDYGRGVGDVPGESHSNPAPDYTSASLGCTLGRRTRTFSTSVGERERATQGNWVSLSLITSSDSAGDKNQGLRRGTERDTGGERGNFL